MARIAGIDLPRDKRIETGLTYIFGIGPTTSRTILQRAGVDPAKRVRDLDEGEVGKLNTFITNNLKIEGDLRREVAANIKRLMDIGCHRGLRHRKSLPVRGQRTRTNARTRKGPRKTVGAKKKETK
jgi:small subunit ribosomal protein S13